ncbi:hypothetical protein niasHT_024065 [Heterodera trifolii]|uniref:BTB domain-containing protein n=1 Tax=Heterodera trifolii TaxID=157864 RepID=A0ABD2JZF0_9BILA
MALKFSLTHFPGAFFGGSTPRRGEPLAVSITNQHSSFLRINFVIFSSHLKMFPCPPNSSPDDDLTVKIGDNQQIAVSAAWLMSLSPVINRMLRVEMKEKQQRALTLDELGVDMELFTEFLMHISPKAVHEPILPGPKNVLLLLKLADYFQMDLLKLRCEKHLVNCVEIPLIDRFLLTKQYGLTILKASHSPGKNMDFHIIGNPNHQEQNVVRLLDEADFESDEGLTNALHLLGLELQNFVEGLHAHGDEESEEETDAD